jgi:hypothetical protein
MINDLKSKPLDAHLYDLQTHAYGQHCKTSVAERGVDVPMMSSPFLKSWEACNVTDKT